MSNPLFYTEIKKINNDTEYQIIDIQNSDSLYGKPAENILFFGDIISMELKKRLIAGDTITISISTMLSKSAGYVDLNDFSIVLDEDLTQYKNRANVKLNNIFTYYLASLSGLTFFKLIQSFSILAANGFFITDLNREEKYLEIINTADDALISALEDYLDCYDAISPTSSMYKSLKQAATEIDGAKTKEEVDIAINMFDM